MPKPRKYTRDDAVPYRGRDRRGIINARPDATGRPFFIAGFGLVVLTAVVFVLQASATARDELTTLAASFELSAGALGVVAATLLVVRWRLAGDARALWLGTAVGTYAALSIALAQLLPVALGEQVDWVRPASLLVSLALFAHVLRSPEVDARLRPGRTFGLAIVGFTAISIAILLLLRVGQDALAAQVLFGPGTGSTAIGVAWATFATIYVLRGMRDQRLLFAWYGLTMFGLTLAELTSVLPTGQVLPLGSALIRSIALLYAVIGVTRELQTMFASQSSRLLQTTVDTLSTSASLRAAQQHQQEMAHEARNALTAIEGATQTLERFRENLDDETRQSLAVAVSSEIGRLQRLVGASAGTNHPVSFRLADIISPQLELARAQGAQVSASTPGDLVAYGQPADFAEVLQNLLINARIHGRGPITVRATLGDDHILVSVEDRGPGVPEDMRHEIFERGRRASHAPGSGLGLYVSRELMKQQRGNLWVEDAADGGAAFIMAVPAGPTATASSFTDSGRLRPVKHGGEGGKPANGHRPLTLGGAEHADVRARARRREHEDPID
ncbi:MAG TPA: HAMP domain-containing sensor histidine kinase [Euzebyales bacterium]